MNPELRAVEAEVCASIISTALSRHRPLAGAFDAR
jgi:hypothetical protein